MQPARSTPLSEPRGVLALVVASFGFSWGFIIVRAAGLPPAWTAFWRVLFGALLLSLIALLKGTSWRVSKMAWVAGLCFGLHQLLFICATQITSIAVVTLVGALQPLIVGLLSRRAVGEEVPRGLWFCSALALLGVAVVVYANRQLPSSNLEGLLAAFANLLAYTAFFLASKQARARGAPALTLTASALGLALLPIVPALFWSAPPDQEPWRVGLLFLMAMGPGNCHLLVNWAHTRVSAALASIVLSLVPVFACVWAYWLFGEAFGLLHVVGMLLTLAAVELGRRAKLG